MLKTKTIFTVIALLFLSFSWSQEEEITPPYNIKTVSFVQNNENVIPIFRFGEGFQLLFDDLFGDEANYYYTITHCDYDWKKSQLTINEYLNGLDNQRIMDYENSFNTLQMYSHYRLRFPNQFTKGFKVSGNYIIKILNNNQEVVFSRKFILYEDLANVPVQVKTPRNVTYLNKKHNLDFSIKPNNMILQDPIRNVKVLLLQNGIWYTAIKNIKPMFTLGTDLIYRYDKETQFWAGNEFLAFDSKDIRVALNGIRVINSQGGVYNTHLYTNDARANMAYTYFPDVNGNFVARNINATTNDAVEADYSWVYFSLSAPTFFGKQDIYITGMFNNYALAPEFKMEYNKSNGLYEKALMIKQGFVNFQYTIADSKGKVDSENAIDGNFYQTENQYDVVVYYRGNTDRYDRVIGRGKANSENIIN
ncbi:MAG TPA: DUF5103 domain-containing protein [Flavobacterium sp.]|nr:DUF5103 domain-containing protein [Flavobacterium sp.]